MNLYLYENNNINIVLDSNIIFSSLIKKESSIRQIIFSANVNFFTSEFLFEEIKKHKKVILKKSGLEENSLNQLLDLILTRINILKSKNFKNYVGEAYKILKDIDLNNVAFVACVLALENSVLWSEDKDLKKQDKIIVWNTSELINYLYKNNLFF